MYAIRSYYGKAAGDLRRAAYRHHRAAQGDVDRPDGQAAVAGFGQGANRVSARLVGRAPNCRHAGGVGDLAFIGIV